MNRDHFKNLSLKYQKWVRVISILSCLILVISFALPVYSGELVLIQTSIEIRELLDETVPGFLMVLNDFFALMEQVDLNLIPVLIVCTIVLSSAFVTWVLGTCLLRRNFRKEPGANCKHCNQFLLTRPHWVLSTGYCFQCGETVCPGEGIRDKNLKSSGLDESKKYTLDQILEIKKEARKWDFLSIIGLLFAVMWAYLAGLLIETPSELQGLFVFLTSILIIFAPLIFIEHYHKRHLKFECPSCNKIIRSTHGYKYDSMLITDRCCPHCRVEIIVDPDKQILKGNELDRNEKLINVKNFIRSEYLFQKGQNLFLLYPLLFIGGMYLLKNKLFLDKEPGNPLEALLWFFSMILNVILPFVFLIWMANKFRKKYRLACHSCSKYFYMVLRHDRFSLNMVRSKRCFHCGRTVLSDD